MKTIFVKPQEVERKWYLIDAAGMPLGKVAVRAASIVRGKEKPEYVTHQEVGDYVVIINADKIILTGRKENQKLYYNHSGYVGGMKVTPFKEMLARKPAYPLEKAIKGMLIKGPLGRDLADNVKIVIGDDASAYKAQKLIKIEL